MCAVRRFLLCMLTLPLLLCACAPVGAADIRPDAIQGDFLSSVCFLGDSTTAHMQQRSSLRSEQVWATKERYLNLDPRITYARILAPDTGEEEGIAAVAGRLRPSYLVITLGVDYGVYYYRDRPETFRFYYEKLLSALRDASPDTVCILQSIFPVGRGSTVITNAMINSANAVIRDIAREHGLFYLDQQPVLADEEGFLRQEFCYSEDGIHLTASAYDAILQNLMAQEKEITKL